MMNWIFDLPETVSAEISTMNSHKMPNDTAVLPFKYANGMIAEITCPFACSASEITTEVCGETGSIIQSYGDAVYRLIWLNLWPIFLTANGIRSVLSMRAETI